MIPISASVENKKVIASQQIFVTCGESFEFKFEIASTPITISFSQEFTGRRNSDPKITSRSPIGPEMRYMLTDCNQDRFISGYIDFASITEDQKKIYSFRIGAIAMGPDLSFSSTWLYIFTLYEEVFPIDYPTP